MSSSNICIQAAEASNKFEYNNSDLKRRYLIKNIDIINTVMESVPGYRGSFGTGYPFYALDSNLEGQLPLIAEQIRYNEELISSAVKDGSTNWVCAKCLQRTGHLMPDLKQICKPCPRIDDDLKPRKVINRLPDVDMWMICDDSFMEEAKEGLSVLFDRLNMHTSDVNPVQTIQDIVSITNSLEEGKMPSKKLPLDIHIIEYSKFSDLIEEVPFVLHTAADEQKKPYLPIHPTSLRKTWQYDDVAYNFVLDFLFTMTPFNWDEDLMDKFKCSKKIVANSFSNTDLKEMLYSVAPDSVVRRLETKQLQKTYNERISSWRK